ncbi:MAG: hypothetical protein N3A01_01150 [Bacteroidales bacterium]|nr:hypothetical protein [Bacteroidales bacterium]
MYNRMWHYLAMTVVVFSCTTDIKQHPDYLRILNERDSLLGLVNTDVSQINKFISDFNEIQENLDKIKETQKIISVMSTNPEQAKEAKDKIIEDINLINDLLLKNKETIERLKRQLRKSDRRILELEKMLANYEKMINEKDQEIIALKTKLEELNIKIFELTSEVDSLSRESKKKDEIIAAKTEELNTAYYVVGTKKELIKNGILTKEGGFIGIGKIMKMKDTFNKEYFTKIDITQTKEIPLFVKDARLLTTHPSGSYEFIFQNKKVEKLLIKNEKDFWSVSKYLVILVEN